jgi:N-acylglucosamine-6-phosphate 2-epimerase
MRPDVALTELAGKLVVSCQADAGKPLDGESYIVALARSVILGGAAGVRIQGIRNVRAVRAAVSVPIIGIIKASQPDSPVYITSRAEEVDALADAGADIIAFDATDRPRPETVPALCRAIHARGLAAMADVSTLAEAEAALAAGAEIVGTTLAGYTDHSRQLDGPDYVLMQDLAKRALPFVAEGRIWTPDEASRAFEIGAEFVVVGSAITRPEVITRRFIDHLNGSGL